MMLFGSSICVRVLAIAKKDSAVTAPYLRGRFHLFQSRMSLLLSTEDLFKELRRSDCAVAKLSEDFHPLLSQAKSDLELTVSANEYGYAIPSPGMPDSCVQIQTHPEFRRVFQACYVREELVFSFDVVQYVPHGKRQTYRGLSSGETTDLIALIVLSKQELNNGRQVDFGDVVFYYANESPELFGNINKSGSPWLGIFCSFWPETHDTYGVHQRSLMLASGRCGLFTPGDEVAVPKASSVFDAEMKSLIIGSNLVPYPMLYVFDGRLKFKRCQWIAGERNPVVSVELKDVEPIVNQATEFKKPASIALSLNPALDGSQRKRKIVSETDDLAESPVRKKLRLDNLIDGLYEALIRDRTGAAQPTPSSELGVIPEVQDDEVQSTVEKSKTCEKDKQLEAIFNEIRQYKYSSTPSTHVSKLPASSCRVDFPSRNVQYVSISDDGKVAYCKAAPFHKLTEHVLYVLVDSVKNFTRDYSFRAFFRISHDQTQVYEIRSQKQFDQEDALNALRALHCVSRGFLVKQKNSKHCSGLFHMAEEDGIEMEKLHKVLRHPRNQEEEPCRFCTWQIKKPLSSPGQGPDHLKVLFKKKVEALGHSDDKENRSPRFSRGLEIATELTQQLTKSKRNKDNAWLSVLDIEDIVQSVCETRRAVANAIRKYERDISMTDERLTNDIARILHENAASAKLSYISQDDCFGCLFSRKPRVLMNALVFHSESFYAVFQDMYQSFTQ